MSAELNQAARVTGPIAAADATWRTGVYRVAFTGSSQSIALPTTGKADGRTTTISRRWVRLLAKGANGQFAMGVGSAPTLSLNAVVSGGNPVATAGATLVDGMPEQLMVPNEVTHFAVIGDNSTTGFFEFYVSDQPFV